MVVIGENDVSWQTLTAEVITTLLSQFDDIVILDLSHLSYPRYVMPPSWSRGMMGIPQTWQERLDQKTTHSLVVHKPRSIFSLKKRLSLGAEEKRVLDNSAYSLTVSLLASQDPFKTHKLSSRIITRRSLARGLRAMALTLDAIKLHKPHTLVVPNGRLPYQKGSKLAGDRENTEVLFYEHGMFRRTHFYLSRFQSHDRVGNQLIASDNNPSKEDLEAAQLWLSQRMDPTSNANPYSVTWPKTHSFDEKIEEESNVLFTSSEDEFLGLDDWQGYGWRTQFECFDFFLKQTQGESVLRVHPNALNKCLSTAYSELIQVRSLAAQHPKLRVVLPNDSVNSYALSSRADRVVVFGSTIGLEASCLGKSVWNGANAIYDTILGVRNLIPHDEKPQEFFEPWSVNEKESLRSLAKLMQLETPYRSFTPQDIFLVAKPPSLFRFINLLRSRSLVYFWSLVLLWLSRYLSALLVELLRRRLNRTNQWLQLKT